MKNREKIGGSIFQADLKQVSTTVRSGVTRDTIGTLQMHKFALIIMFHYKLYCQHNNLSDMYNVE